MLDRTGKERRFFVLKKTMRCRETICEDKVPMK